MQIKRTPSPRQEGGSLEGGSLESSMTFVFDERLALCDGN